MRYLLHLIVILFCVFSAKPAQFTKPVTTTADSVVIKLKAKRAAVDSYLAKHPKAVTALVKVPGKNNLVTVIGDKWPDEIEYTYNIVKNDAGKIILITQEPESESGDWSILAKHYFDEGGNTFAFYWSEAIFTDAVKGGVAGKELSKYYDPMFKIISQTNQLVNVNHKPLKAKEEQFDFRDHESRVYKNVKDCLAGYGITSIK